MASYDRSRSAVVCVCVSSMLCGFVLVWLPNFHHSLQKHARTHSRGIRKHNRTQKSKPNKASDMQSEYQWANVLGKFAFGRVCVYVFGLVNYCSARRAVSLILCQWSNWAGQNIVIVPRFREEYYGRYEYHGFDARLKLDSSFYSNWAIPMFAYQN